MMNNEQLQLIYQLSSYLLNYPTDEFVASLKEIEAEVEELSLLNIKEELHHFFHKTRQISPAELIETYVNTFDFGKKSNLYVTYMTNGEQRERGMDLLFLKNYYQLHGLGVTDKELPDYLPIMLEFASQVDADIRKPVFERYFLNIKEIESQIDPKINLYGHLLKTIILVLEEDGITKSVRRSEEICSSSFCG